MKQSQLERAWARELAVALLATHLGIVNMAAKEIELLENALNEIREAGKPTLLLAYMVELVKRVCADCSKLREECTKEMLTL